MAPNPSKFEQIRNRLFSLNKAAASLNSRRSIDALTETKEAYLVWLLDAREFVKKHKLDATATALWFDAVTERDIYDGFGTGISWGDARSTSLLKILREAIRANIASMDMLSSAIPNEALQRREGIFYYLGKVTPINKKTVPFNLLDILFSLRDDEGFVDYDTIIKELKKRKSSGSLGILKDISKKTIANGYKDLFIRTNLPKKVIEVRHGKGLVLDIKK